MTLRYERNRESTVNLTGGPYVTFPAGVVEIDLDDPDREQRIADHYEAVELVEAEAESEDGSDADLCGTIKTNGEPCDRPADECRWHSQDDDEEDEDSEESDEDGGEEDAAAEFVASTPNPDLEIGDSADSEADSDDSDDEDAED